MWFCKKLRRDFKWLLFLLDCMGTHAEEIGSSGWESAGAACCVQCGCNLAAFDASEHQKEDTKSHLAGRSAASFAGAVVIPSGQFHRSHLLICLNTLHSVSETTWLGCLSNSYTKIVEAQKKIKQNKHFFFQWITQLRVYMVKPLCSLPLQRLVKNKQTGGSQPIQPSHVVTCAKSLLWNFFAAYCSSPVDWEQCYNTVEAGGKNRSSDTKWEHAEQHSSNRRVLVCFLARRNNSGSTSMFQG